MDLDPSNRPKNKRVRDVALFQGIENILSGPRVKL